jgi:hypothetical protein
MPATEPGGPGAAEEIEVQVPPLLVFEMRERDKRMVVGHQPLLSASADMST